MQLKQKGLNLPNIFWISVMTGLDDLRRLERMQTWKRETEEKGGDVKMQCGGEEKSDGTDDEQR